MTGTQIELSVAGEMEQRPNEFMVLVDKIQHMTPEAQGKVLDNYERFLAIQAKQAYDMAMQSFKANAPNIFKNKKASITPKDGKPGYGYSYATLDNACEVLDEPLSANGFSYRWDTEHSDKGIVVSCILTHVQGHSEKTTLPPAPHDISGGKNPIQAIGSTLKYLQRYSLLSAVGMTPRDVPDTDGKVVEQKQGGKMPQKERDERIAHFRKTDLTYQEVDAHYKASYAEAHKVHDQEAMDMFIAAKKMAYDRLREKQ